MPAAETGTRRTTGRDAEILAALSKLERIIDERVGGLSSELVLMRAEVNRLGTLGEDNRRALRGYNGEPGIAARVKGLEEGEQHCRIHEIARFIDGTDKEAGLFERLRAIEKIVDEWKRVLIFIAVFIGGDILIRLWPKVLELLNGAP